MATKKWQSTAKWFFRIRLLWTTVAFVVSSGYSQKKIKIGVSAWVDSGALYFAEEKGFFEQERVDVVLDPISDYPPTLVNVAYLLHQHSPDGVVTPIDTFFLPIIWGILPEYEYKSVSVLAMTFQGYGIAIRSDVKTLFELIGENVGCLPQDLSAVPALTFQIMQRFGFSEYTPKYVDLQPESFKAVFQERRIAAAVLPQSELETAKREGFARIIVSGEETPGLVTSVLSFRSDVIKERPEDIARIIRAYFRAVDYRATHPEEFNDVVAERLASVNSRWKDRGIFLRALQSTECYGRDFNFDYFGTREETRTIYGDIYNAFRSVELLLELVRPDDLPSEIPGARPDGPPGSLELRQHIDDSILNLLIGGER